MCPQGFLCIKEICLFNVPLIFTKRPHSSNFLFSRLLLDNCGCCSRCDCSALPLSRRYSSWRYSFFLLLIVCHSFNGTTRCYGRHTVSQRLRDPAMSTCPEVQNRFNESKPAYLLILNMSPYHSCFFMQTFLPHWGRFVGEIGLAEVRTRVFGHVRSIINCMTVLMISELPLMTIMFEDARTLTTEISSSNHIWQVKSRCERSLFSPFLLLVHDPDSNFQTVTSLRCTKTQTSR